MSKGYPEFFFVKDEEAVDQLSELAKVATFKVNTMVLFQTSAMRGESM